MSTPFKILVLSDARRLIPVNLVFENVHTHVQRRAGACLIFNKVYDTSLTRTLLKCVVRRALYSN